MRERKRSAGPDEVTVALGRNSFESRRRRERLRAARPYLYGLLALIVVVGGGWLLYLSSYVTVQRVKVSGNENISAARIEDQAKVPIGKQLIRVDLDAIRARVENLGIVRSADVSRAWPHEISIQITERTPVAVVQRENELRAVDGEGVLFGHYGRRPDGLPLIIADPRVGTQALSGGATVAAALSPGLARRVEHLQLDSVDKITLVLRSGVKIIWGSADSSTEKAQVAEVLLRRKVNEIDVSVPSRPTTRG